MNYNTQNEFLNNCNHWGEVTVKRARVTKVKVSPTIAHDMCQFCIGLYLKILTYNLLSHLLLNLGNTNFQKEWCAFGRKI
jgi:hypothetical protein